MSNTALPISQLPSGGCLLPTDKIPVARESSTYAASFTLKNEGGILADSSGYSITPQYFVDGTTITYNEQTGKISATGTSAGVSSITNSTSILASQPTGAVTLNAKVSNNDAILIDNTKGICWGYDNQLFQVTNSQATLKAGSTLKLFSNLPAPTNQQDGKVIGISNGIFAYVDQTAGGGIASINGDTTSAQIINAKINDSLSVAFEFTIPTAGTQQLNLALDDTYFGVANSEVTITNANLGLLGALNLTGQNGKALIATQSGQSVGFGFGSFLANLPTIVNAAQPVNATSLAFTAGANMTITPSFNAQTGLLSMEFVSSGGGGGSYTAGNGISINVSNVISANIDTDSALQFNGVQLSTKANVTALANLNISAGAGKCIVVNETNDGLELSSFLNSISVKTPEQANPFNVAGISLLAGANTTITSQEVDNIAQITIASTGGGAGVSSFQGSQQGSTTRTGAVVAQLGDYNAEIIRMDNTNTSALLSDTITNIKDALITSVSVSGGNVTGTGTINNNVLNLALNASGSSSNSTYFNSAQLVGANALGTGLNYQDANAVILPYRCVALGANASLSTMNFNASATSSNNIQLSVAIQCFADNTLSSASNMVFPYLLYAFNTSTNTLTQIDSGSFSFSVNAKDDKTYTVSTNQVSVGITTNNFMLLIQGISGSSGHVGLLGINITPTIS